MSARRRHNSAHTEDSYDYSDDFLSDEEGAPAKSAPEKQRSPPTRGEHGFGFFHSDYCMRLLLKSFSNALNSKKQTGDGMVSFINLDVHHYQVGFFLSPPLLFSLFLVGLNIY